MGWLKGDGQRTSSIAEHRDEFWSTNVSHCGVVKEHFNRMTSSGMLWEGFEVAVEDAFSTNSEIVKAEYAS